MKLSEFLSDLGRPVAFYPGLVKALGDRNEAIFICQMAYWKGKGENKEGWIYKTAEEIEDETSLTYKEQTNVRDGLKSKGLLQEYNARTEHKMYYRIMWDKVNSIWEQFTNGKVVLDQWEGGSLPEVISLNSNTENTQENKHHLGIENKIAFDLPITEDDLETEKSKTLATRQFENALGFSKPLPWWDGNKDWLALARWVESIYQSDNLAFGEYNIWRNTKYTKGGMTNSRLRGFPKEFYDSWDMFLMSKEPEHKTNEERPYYESIPERVKLPRPDHIPAPRLGGIK